MFTLCVTFNLFLIEKHKLDKLPSYNGRLTAALDEWKIETSNMWKELDKKIEDGYYND